MSRHPNRSLIRDRSKASPLVGVTHHDQHHRYFRCNYATHFSVWDRIMGTLHPDHDAELKHNIEVTEAARRNRSRLRQR
jgi:sterol desaturase/sphingolipid hydroxylase (fatty acid hydroxylase superfamily)